MTPGHLYETSPIKRARRTGAAMEDIRVGIERVVADEQPCTLRQIFYRLVAGGVVAKTEREYLTIARLLVEMRREGRIPFSAIADSTRWMRKPRTWSSLEAALRQTKHTYRRSLWNDQSVYVEVWCEKDALAGVLVDATEKWDVPLMVSRGFASVTFLHSAAKAIEAAGKPAYLYYFGDHDPSGLVIPRKIEQTLREYAPCAEIHFERVAVLPAQILEWSLPTRPTKRAGNTHAKRFAGESVEVDAIPPRQLRALCDRCITQHIDQAAYQATLRVEKAERETLDALVRGLGRGGEVVDMIDWLKRDAKGGQ